MGCQRTTYEINKGIVGKSRREHYAVNEQVPATARRVPFKNMIYVGDGLTDVPCFSLVSHFGGTGFGVFDPKEEGSPKKAYENLVTTRRTISTHSPHYREKDDLGAIIRVAVAGICSRLDVDSQRAE